MVENVFNHVAHLSSIAVQRRALWRNQGGGQHTARGGALISHVGLLTTLITDNERVPAAEGDAAADLEGAPCQLGLLIYLRNGMQHLRRQVAACITSTGLLRPLRWRLGLYQASLCKMMCACSYLPQLT